MKGRMAEAQPTLIHVPAVKDLVDTPRWLARLIVDHYEPHGRTLDPCMGNGVFYDCLPVVGREWCEIGKGRDFFLYDGYVDWIVSNPPYSILLQWIRHSLLVADHVVYLLPLHRVMGSFQFVQDVAAWGGLREVFVLGTGTSVGFPFGHCMAAVHYEHGYRAGTKWTYWEGCCE